MNAVTDPDYADEATGAESSSHEGEDTGPESSKFVLASEGKIVMHSNLSYADSLGPRVVRN